MDFVEIPYLPKKKTALAVADIKMDNIKTILPCPQLELPAALSKHADLSFCYLGRGNAVCARGSLDYYKAKLKGIPIRLTEGDALLDRHYPYDAAYNVAIVGKKLFCKKSAADKVLLTEAEKMGYKIININQGYSKCSVCPIDEQSAISADKSFAKKAEAEGIEVLLITNDAVLLPPYKNGFFGGCAFMADKNTLNVKGDINSHPDCGKITEFLAKRNIQIKSLDTGSLFDFGSFIPLLEE